MYLYHLWHLQGSTFSSISYSSMDKRAVVAHYIILYRGSGFGQPAPLDDIIWGSFSATNKFFSSFCLKYLSFFVVHATYCINHSKCTCSEICSKMKWLYKLSVPPLSFVDELVYQTCGTDRDL